MPSLRRKNHEGFTVKELTEALKAALLQRMQEISEMETNDVLDVIDAFAASWPSSPDNPENYPEAPMPKPLPEIKVFGRVIITEKEGDPCVVFDGFRVGSSASGDDVGDGIEAIRVWAVRALETAVEEFQRGRTNGQS